MTRFDHSTDDTPDKTPDDNPDGRIDDERASAYRSYVALAFVAALVAAAVWLFNSFREHNRTIECFEQGRHDCVPFDTTARGA